eukprot:TRINITY_DN3441_c0_g3_i1.p1 TRINITY_DN3441_c0_g3~~TRINITY_DN3441_c0_g3_i1.p1  ORF type:complete len:729 (-),score=120.89 TRINITY_DN3441_c0_g3_i1:58-2244(-)
MALQPSPAIASAELTSKNLSPLPDDILFNEIISYRLSSLCDFVRFSLTCKPYYLERCWKDQKSLTLELNPVRTSQRHLQAFGSQSLDAIRKCPNLQHLHQRQASSEFTRLAPILGALSQLQEIELSMVNWEDAARDVYVPRMHHLKSISVHAPIGERLECQLLVDLISMHQDVLEALSAPSRLLLAVDSLPEENPTWPRLNRLSITDTLNFPQLAPMIQKLTGPFILKLSAACLFPWGVPSSPVGAVETALKAIGRDIPPENVYVSDVPLLIHVLTSNLLGPEHKRRPDRLDVLVSFYQRAKRIVNSSIVIRLYNALCSLADEAPSDQTSSQWLRDAEFESLTVDYGYYDLECDYLIDFCSGFLLKAIKCHSEIQASVELDRCSRFIAEHGGDLNLMPLRLFLDHPEIYSSVIRLVLFHAVFGPIFLNHLNSLALDDIELLDDTAQSAYFIYCPLERLARFLELNPNVMVESWPVLRTTLLRNAEARQSHLTLVKFKRETDFLQASSHRAIATTQAAVTDLTENDFLMAEFATVFDDAPYILKPENIESNYAKCIRRTDWSQPAPPTLSRIFQPWTLLQSSYKSVRNENASDFAYFCTDERLAKLFTRVILRNCDVNFPTIINAALECFPPIAAEFSDFVTGTSELYKEQIRQSGAPLAGAQAVVASALADQGYSGLSEYERFLAMDEDGYSEQGSNLDDGDDLMMQDGDEEDMADEDKRDIIIEESV